MHTMDLHYGQVPDTFIFNKIHFTILYDSMSVKLSLYISYNFESLVLTR